MKPGYKYYAAVVAYYYFIIWYDQNYIDMSKITKFSPKSDFQFFKGRLKYLTQWNMLLQTLFFTISFLNEIIGSSLIRKLKDLILPCLAFPIAMFVGLTFWGLYFVDRELVFPKAIDAFFPVWLNHVMHTNIMVFMLLELYTTFRRYPSKLVGLSILTVFMGSYLFWIHVIFYNTGIWVYPVLDLLDFIGRIVFFGGLLFLSFFLYLVGEKLNQKIWLNRVKFTDQKDD